MAYDDIFIDYAFIKMRLLKNVKSLVFVMLGFIPGLSAAEFADPIAYIKKNGYTASTAGNANSKAFVSGRTVSSREIAELEKEVVAATKRDEILAFCNKASAKVVTTVPGAYLKAYGIMNATAACVIKFSTGTQIGYTKFDNNDMYTLFITD